MRTFGLLSRRRSVLFGWLVWYLLILAVPLVVTVLTYVATVGILEKEITDANLVLLRRLREQIDSQIETAWRLAQEIAINPRVIALTREAGAPPDRYALYELSRDFRTYRTLYPAIQDFYLYLPATRTVLSAAGLFDAAYFHQVYLRDQGVSAETWHAELDRARRGEFVLVDPDMGSGAGFLVYIQSVPLFAGGEPDANIVVSFARRSFVEEARTSRMLDGALVYILAPGDRLVAASVANELSAPLSYAELPDEQGLLYVAGRKGPGVASCITSALTEWKYLVLVPRDTFWRKAQTARELAGAGLGFCLVAGAVLVVAALRRNYNPLAELVGMLERFQGRVFGREEDEYGFIRRAIAQAEEERQKYGIVVAQQNRILRDNLLRRILKGWLAPSETAADRLYLHGIRFPSERFVVLVLYVGEYDEVFAPAKESQPKRESQRTRDPYEEYRRVLLIISAAFEELLSARGHGGVVVEVDDILAVLIALGGEGRPRTEIDAIAEQARVRLADGLGVHFAVAASRVYHGIEGAAQAYAEAIQTMEYQRILGQEEVMHFEDIAGLQRGRYEYPPETERRLINAIRTGDRKKAEQIIEDVCARNFAPGHLSAAAARCLMLDLASTIIKAADELETSASPESLAARAARSVAAERLLACQTAQELEAALREAAGRCADAVAEDMAARTRHRSREWARQLAEDAARYIEVHFSDPGLDIGALARELGAHPITLSRVFHEQTGEGLLEHMNRVRVERAIALMRERREEPIEEICRAVGYGSARTFTRAFKRVQGVTPGRYRASLDRADSAAE